MVVINVINFLNGIACPIQKSRFYIASIYVIELLKLFVFILNKIEFKNKLLIFFCTA